MSYLFQQLNISSLSYFCSSINRWIHQKWWNTWYFQFSSVTQSCPTLCDPMHCSTPGLPVHQQLPELIQTHVHWVSDTIQSFHPLLSPSPPFFNLSLHQGRFKGVSSSHQVANILEFQLQHQSSQWTFGTDFLWAGLVGSHNILQDAYQSTHNPNKEEWESYCITTITWHISH